MPSPMNPAFQQGRVTIYQGDVLEVLRTLPDECVQTVVTSPPYWGLRDYGTATWHGGDAECDHIASELRRGVNLAQSSASTRGGAKKIAEAGGIPFRETCGKCGAVREDRQIGLETSPAEYIAKMVEVFREVRRALRSDGTLWLNMGDSYAAYRDSKAVPDSLRGDDDGTAVSYASNRNGKRLAESGLKHKDLVGMPWRLALALQADGWYLRSDIIWAKPNPMPESVTDRPTKAHEYIFLLAKSERYFYDAEAIKESSADPERERSDKFGGKNGHLVRHSDGRIFEGSQTRNKRTVWTVATEPFPEAHFATFPTELIKPCILAGTSERGACPICGAPWERIVERPVPPVEMRSGTGGPDDGRVKNFGSQGKRYGSGQKMQDWYDENPSRTTGWKPTCKCAAVYDVQHAACIVLDPFAGSGTTLEVARMNGCAGIGIELNAEYIEIAKRRLRQDVLTFG